MIKLFETFGLTYPEMADVTAYILLVITFGVFAGKCFYDGACAIADIIWAVLGFLYRLAKKHLRKHFPNVRKQKGVKVMTNGDTIRSMTDEELANFLATDAVIACVHCKGAFHLCSENLPCTKSHEAAVFFEWLGEEWKPGRWTFE